MGVIVKLKDEKKQMSETFLLGTILAVVGGFLDAYTYLCREHVFANAQTGNIVLLGAKMAEGNWSGALYYLIPITSFLLGIAIAELIKNKYKNNKKIHWRQIIIAFEILVLIVVAFIPQGNANTSANLHAIMHPNLLSYLHTNMIANVLVSFVCSLQVQSFRKMNGKAYATTMCTGNLRSAMEGLCNYRLTKSRIVLISSLQYFGIVLFFIIGAALGAVLTDIFNIKSILFACIGLVIVFILMFWKGENS